LRLIVGLSALFLCACDNSGTTGDTGSISFNLEWKSGVSDESNLVLTANGDVCENYQISTISATVYDATDKNIANKSFACTDHSGSFAGIPAGSGYRIVIKGMVSGNPDWTGQKGGLAVTDGQTTNAGTISMTYSGSDETPPEVLLVSPGISVTSVAVNTSVTAVFNETMNPSSFKATSFLLQNTADNSEIAGSVAYNSASRIATFTPDADLSANTEYRVTLTAMITDIAGNPLPGGGYSWTFFTGDLTCATVLIQPRKPSILPAGPAKSRSPLQTMPAHGPPFRPSHGLPSHPATAEPAVGPCNLRFLKIPVPAPHRRYNSCRRNVYRPAGRWRLYIYHLPNRSNHCVYRRLRSVSVTASRSDCAWTATSGAPWISVTSGSSGTGSGSVGFSVAENTTTSPRTGTITVAGTPFTVEQGENAGLPKWSGTRPTGMK
ncbi:MAG: Ig-like domain-containing protein, partial [Desulfobacterales bacterium]